MTRKETIIVAVLINAGLLVILFATALGPKFSSPVNQEALIAVETVEPIGVPAAPVAASTPTDEVDQMLKQYSAVIATESVNLQQPSSPASESSPKSDLAIINTAESKPAKEQSSSSQHIEVKVKKGDVLEKIARTHHCNVEEIMQLNNLTSTRLNIGQKLRIPSKVGHVEKQTQVVAPAPVQTTSSTQEGAKYYVVKHGDNLWTIAVKNHMKVEELLRLNHLDQDKARRLKPGDQIRIK